MDDELAEAFRIVATACANVQGNLETHQTIQRALGVIKERLDPTPSVEAVPHDRSA